MSTTTIKIFDAIISRDALIQFFGAFFGAFFTFLLFIIFEKIKKKWQRKSKLKKAHHLIEKYLYRILGTLEYNSGLIVKIIEDLDGGKRNIMELDSVVVEQEFTSDISDLLFMNRMNHLSSKLNILRLNQESFGVWRKDIVEHIEKENFDRVKREMKNFSKQGGDLIKFFNLNKEVVEDLLLENRVLLQKYKNWNKFFFKKTEKEINIRKDEVEKARKEYEKEKQNNPFQNEYIEKLKKHGL